MTRRLSYTRLSKSRFLGLEHLAKEALTAPELGQKMWPGHRMATVNARAIFRELKVTQLVVPVDGDLERFRATEGAKELLANPSWICRYCSLDTTDSMKRLWDYPCMGCEEVHRVCRLCKKQLLKPTGDFPYVLKVRGCPGTVPMPLKQEKKKKFEEVHIQKEL